jgi:hypothetical protein
MKSRAIALISAMALGVGVSAAQADTASVATLTQVNGKVMVNKGQGFTTAKAGMSLSNNDRIITLDDSSAAIAFADGCVNSMKSNSVLAVSKTVGCNAQAMSVHSTMPTGGKALQYAAVGGTVTANDSDGDGIPNLADKCPDTPLGKAVNDVGCESTVAGWWPGVVAGLVIIGIASNDDDNKSGQ